MRTVKVRLRKADLAGGMVTMRQWLDQSGYAPNRFDCARAGDTLVILVDFTVDVQGEAFAARFGNHPGLSSASGERAPAAT
jgi:hypothetical protein